jgi:hypothetical protein
LWNTVSVRIQSETLARAKHSSGVANLKKVKRRGENWIRYDHSREDVDVYVDAVVVQKQQYQQDGCFHDKLSTTGDVVGVVPTHMSLRRCRTSGLVAMMLSLDSDRSAPTTLDSTSIETATATSWHHRQLRGQAEILGTTKQLGSGLLQLKQ